LPARAAPTSRWRRPASTVGAAIEEIDQEVDADVEPFRAAIALLTTIPGVSILSGDPPGCARGLLGSRRPWSNAPAPPPAGRASYLQAQFHRLRARRGAKKAIGALAASILTTVYHMLISGELYRDLGPDHFDRRAKARQTNRLLARLQNLGYAVQITPLAA